MGNRKEHEGALSRPISLRYDKNFNDKIFVMGGRNVIPKVKFDRLIIGSN